MILIEIFITEKSIVCLHKTFDIGYALNWQFQQSEIITADLPALNVEAHLQHSLHILKNYKES